MKRPWAGLWTSWQYREAGGGNGGRRAGEGGAKGAGLEEEEEEGDIVAVLLWVVDGWVVRVKGVGRVEGMHALSISVGVAVEQIDVCT